MLVNLFSDTFLIIFYYSYSLILNYILISIMNILDKYY